MSAISKEKYIDITLPKIGKQKIVFDFLLLDQHEALTDKKIYEVWKDLGEAGKSLIQIVKDAAIIVYAGVLSNYLREGKDTDTLPNFHQFLSDFGNSVSENPELTGEILDSYAFNVSKITGTNKEENLDDEEKKNKE